MVSSKKTAFVTGSSRGIGLGIAKSLLASGYTVILSGTKPETPESYHELKKEGLDVYYIPCEISDKSGREESLSKILTQFGRIDLLVNNAGVAPEVRNDILAVKEDSFDRLVNINLKGTFFMCQLFANTMIKDLKDILDYKPRIVNVSSISAYTSSPNRGEYCVSKAGIAMVTSLFADKLAEYGIPVFEVRPGIIKTDMTSGVVEKYDKFIFEDNGLPIKRWGLPEDIGNAVAGLVSGAFDYCTGQVINVDGGFHIRRL